MPNPSIPPAAFVAARLRMLAAGLLAMLLAACTVGLTPAYDADLAEGLNQTNHQTMVLFAELEEGSPAADYAGHAGDYAKAIGAFAELRARAAARPVPPLASRLAKVPIVQSFCHSKTDPTACLNASPASLGQVLDTLRTMRATHRSGGLTPALVEGFEREYITAVQQALTVESALKR
ncbi:MAG: hypothetical protein KGL44_03140 [Sphingomonadales bacterium]|nr:hypothetical protein [Sphingomonadales bacterium]